MRTLPRRSLICALLGLAACSGDSESDPDDTDAGSPLDGSLADSAAQAVDAGADPLDDAASAPGDSATGEGPRLGGLAAVDWLKQRCAKATSPRGPFQLSTVSAASCAASPPFTTPAAAQAMGCTTSKYRVEDIDADGDGIVRTAELYESGGLCRVQTSIDCNGTRWRWRTPYGSVDGYSTLLDGPCSYSAMGPNYDVLTPGAELQAACVTNVDWQVGPLLRASDAPAECPAQPPFDSPAQALASGCRAIAPYTGIGDDDPNQDLIATFADVSENTVSCRVVRAFDCQGALWQWSGALGASKSAALMQGNQPYSNCRFESQR